MSSDILNRIQRAKTAYKNLSNLLSKDFKLSGFRLKVFYLDGKEIADFEIRGEDKNPIFESMLVAIKNQNGIRESLLKTALKDLGEIK